MDSGIDPHPTAIELEALQVIWKNGKATVRQVMDGLAARKLAMTTIATVLNRMVAKGLLLRRKDGPGKYYYTATVTEERTQRYNLGEFIRKFFAGSTPKLIQNALDAQELNPAELDEIQKVIQRVKQGKR